MRLDVAAARSYSNQSDILRYELMIICRTVRSCHATNNMRFVRLGGSVNY